MSQLWISYVHVFLIFSDYLDDVLCCACVCYVCVFFICLASCVSLFLVHDVFSQTSWEGGKRTSLGSDLKSLKDFWNPYQGTWDLLLMEQKSGEKTTQHEWNPVDKDIMGFIMSTVQPNFKSINSITYQAWDKLAFSESVTATNIRFWSTKDRLVFFRAEANVWCPCFFWIKQPVRTSRCFAATFWSKNWRLRCESFWPQG